MASVTIFNGQSCLLWDDLWDGQVRRLLFPELHSFAKNNAISLSCALSADSLLDLFSLPLSVEAHSQFHILLSELANIVLQDASDI